MVGEWERKKGLQLVEMMDRLWVCQIVAAKEAIVAGTRAMMLDQRMVETTVAKTVRQKEEVLVDWMAFEKGSGSVARKVE